MKKIMAISCIFFLTALPAKGLELTPLGKILFHLEMKNSLQNKDSKRIKDRKKYCHEKFDSLKGYWQEDVKDGDDFLIPNAKLEREPTRQEILDKEGRVRFPSRFIKGNAKRLDVAWMLGGSPDFPHHRPSCSKFFNYEVSLIEIGDSPCRQVHFYSPKDKSKEYYQVYCAGEKSVYINFHPHNRLKKPSDCAHCR